MSARAIGQEKTGNKEGFALKPGTMKIILMRPVIGVGEQSTGGLYDAKVEVRHVYLDPDTIWVSRLDLSRGRYGAALASCRV